MAALSSFTRWLPVATTVASTAAQIQAGNAAERQSEMLAAQREREANAAQVEAQQVAARERKKSRYLRSRVLAVAGASGGGVSDPTINNILTGLDVEGEMSALNALHNGDSTAASYRMGARMAREEGSAAKSASRWGAGVTALSGLSEFQQDNPSFFKKYGGDRAEKYSSGLVQPSDQEEEILRARFGRNYDDMRF